MNYYAKRKTSGRYKLVFIEPQTGKQIEIKCDVLTGKILQNSGSKQVKGLDLPVLDQFILNNITGENNLRLLTTQFGYQVPSSYVPRIIYRSNGQTKYLELVYQEKQLCRLANMCQIYKQKNSKSLFNSSDDRQFVSKEIQREFLWKQFYQNLLQWIHQKEFLQFLKRELLIGGHVLEIIEKYMQSYNLITLNPHHTTNYSESELKNVFSSYKPIRGMIICQKKYLDFIEMKSEVEEISRKIKSQTMIVDSISLLSDSQLMLLMQYLYEYMDELQRQKFIKIIENYEDCKINRITPSDIEFSFISNIVKSKSLFYEAVPFLTDSQLILWGQYLYEYMNESQKQRFIEHNIINDKDKIPTISQGRNFLEYVKNQMQQSFIDELHQIDWNERILNLLTEEQIAYLESHDFFEQLSDQKKFQFVSGMMENQKVYQKKI